MERRNLLHFCVRRNMVEFRELGFYAVDVDYLQFLNKNDPEVYYTESYRTAVKPIFRGYCWY